MKTLLKIVVIVLIVVLIFNLVLMALGKISILLFWIILILGIISSYVINKIIKPKL